MTPSTLTPSTSTDRPRRTVVRASWLFDGTGSVLVPDPVLVLDGGTIRAVDHAVPPPPDAELLDLPGATLLPGLIDTHVHLAFDAGRDPVRALAERDDGAALDAMTAAGRTALRAGVTTIRDLGDRDYLALKLAGRPDLPTIVAAGPPITTPRGHCHYLGGGVEPTIPAIRAAVREHVDRGAQVVKLMASGGNLTPGTDQTRAQFPPDVLRAAVDEAHRHGLPVTAHAHGTAAIADALAAGVDGMEHVSFWTAAGVDAPERLIRGIADRRIVVGATLGMVPVPGFAPPVAVSARLPRMLANHRRLHAAGAPLVAGTDAGIGPVKPHDVLTTALRPLRDIGLDPAESLRAITSVAAAVCGLGHRKGRLVPGYDADLLAVDGDPRTDPDALRRVRGVLAHGQVVRR